MSKPVAVDGSALCRYCVSLRNQQIKWNLACQCLLKGKCQVVLFGHGIASLGLVLGLVIKADGVGALETHENIS